MRSPVDVSRLRAALEELGKRATGAGRVYLVGGASALLLGWRESTVDIDLEPDPEPAGLFEAIAEVKRRCDVNIELASPGHFVPIPEDWREHSPFVARFGEVDFFHFDFRSQALAKIARGYDRDLADARAMLERELTTTRQLREAFEEIRPRLLRYPGLDAEAFSERFADFLEEAERG